MARPLLTRSAMVSSSRPKMEDTDKGPTRREEDGTTARGAGTRKPRVWIVKDPNRVTPNVHVRILPSGTCATEQQGSATMYGIQIHLGLVLHQACSGRHSIVKTHVTVIYFTRSSIVHTIRPHSRYGPSRVKSPHKR